MNSNLTDRGRPCPSVCPSPTVPLSAPTADNFFFSPRRVRGGRADPGGGAHAGAAHRRAADRIGKEAERRSQLRIRTLIRALSDRRSRPTGQGRRPQRRRRRRGSSAATDPRAHCGHLAGTRPASQRGPFHFPSLSDFFVPLSHRRAAQCPVRPRPCPFPFPLPTARRAFGVRELRLDSGSHSQPLRFPSAIGRRRALRSFLFLFFSSKNLRYMHHLVIISLNESTQKLNGLIMIARCNCK